MFCVTDCLLYIKFPFTEKDSQFILTVIFIFISKLNHIISKLEMTAAFSLCGCWRTTGQCGLLHHIMSVKTYWRGLNYFLPGSAKWTEQRKKKRNCLPAHNFMGKKNSAHFWILVLALINYGLWKEMRVK